MTFSFHPAAEAEFQSAVDYYEGCEAGLGYDFSLEIFTGIQNIVSYPAAWPVLENEIRRCLVNRFPYGIVYTIERDNILILAVMHLRQHPDSWKDRDK